MPSELEMPVSLAAESTGVPGVALGTPTKACAIRLAMGVPRPETRSYPVVAL